MKTNFAKNHFLSFVVLSFFIFLFVLPLFTSILPQQSPLLNTVPQKTFADNGTPTQSNSESPIDSMDVNPRSGRWSVTNTPVSLGSIDQSNLKLVVPGNTTASDYQSYLMTRPLSVTSGNIEYRINSTLTNSSEFFTDQYGNPNNFILPDQSAVNTTYSNGIDPAWNLYCCGSGEMFNAINQILVARADGGHTNIGFSSQVPVDTNIYNSITVRYYISSSDYSTDHIEIDINSAVGTAIIPNNSQWYTLTISNIPIATGVQTIQVLLDGNGGANLQAGDQIMLSYISMNTKTSLTTPSNVQSTFALQDPTTNRLVANITQHFINSSYFYWYISLSDANNNIVAYYTSGDYLVTNVYYRVKISFDLTLSQFSVSINDDSYNQLFKVVYPGSFIVKGIPDLFTIQSFPSVAFYAKTNATGIQNIMLDYISAQWNTNNWYRPYPAVIPSGTSFVSDSYSQAIAAGSGNQPYTWWALNIPRLDTVSGTFLLNTTKYNSGVTYSILYFYVQGIDALTGSAYNVSSFTENYNALLGSPPYAYSYAYNGGTSVISDTYHLTQISAVQVVFSLSTSANRNNLITNLQFQLGSRTLTAAFNRTISTIVPHPSQEYRLVVEYEFTTSSGSNGIIQLLNFQFQSHDIFSGLLSGLSGLIGTGSDFLGNLFQSLIGILAKYLGLAFQAGFAWLVVALAPLFVGVSTAINTYLGPLISAVTSALNSLLAGVASTLTNIYNTVASLASNIISDLWNGIQTNLINPFLSALNNIIQNTIIPGLLSVASVIISTLSGILDFFIGLLPWGLPGFIRGFNHINGSDVTSAFANFFNILVIFFSLGFKGFFIVCLIIDPTIPILKHLDDLPGGVSEIFTQFRQTYDLNVYITSIPIPFFVIWFVFFILSGYFSTYFPFNPF